MRNTKAKQLRKQSQQNAAIQNTTYVHGVKWANGQAYSVSTTKQLNPECARGVYQVLKSVSKEV